MIDIELVNQALTEFVCFESVYSKKRYMFLARLTYTRVRNKHIPTLNNFRNFFQGLRSYYRLHKFAHFKEPRLFVFFLNFTEATFILGGTSIPDSNL